jgi:hypothetical protein
MSSRRRKSGGIARVFLGCAKAAPVGRGHKHPRARNRPCETGLSWGMVVLSRHQFPGPRPDVHGPPLPAGFGISRVLGSVGSSRSATNRLWRQGSVTPRLASGEEPIAVSFPPFVLEAAAAKGPPPPRSVLSPVLATRRREGRSGCGLRHDTGLRCRSARHRQGDNLCRAWW